MYFVNDNMELNNIKNNLITALTKSLDSFMKLIEAFSADGYIKDVANHDNNIAKHISNELIAFQYAYVHINYSDYIDELIDSLPVIAGAYFDRELFIGYSRDFAKDLNYKKLELTGFDILNRFDQMAMEYEGAFYKNLNLASPGRLGQLYLDLFENIGALISIITSAEQVNSEYRDYLNTLSERFL